MSSGKQFLLFIAILSTMVTLAMLIPFIIRIFKAIKFIIINFFAKRIFNRYERGLFTSINNFLGLDLEVTDSGSLCIKGRYRTYPVIIEKVLINNYEYITVKIILELEKYSSFAISSAHFPMGRESVDERSYVFSGSTDFDRHARIDADDPLFAVASLNSSVRKMLMALCSRLVEFNIDNYSITLAVPLFTALRVRRIRDFLVTAVSVANNISSGELLDKLVENIHKEKNRDILLINIENLGTHFGEQEVTVATLRDLLAHKKKAVQVRAARYLKEEGLRHVLKMVKRIKYLSAVIKIDIVITVRQNKYSKLNMVLMDMFKSTSSFDLKIEILDTLAEFNDAEIVKFLQKEMNLRRNRDYYLKLKIIEALARTGDKSRIEEINKIIKAIPSAEITKEMEGIIASILSKLGIEKGMLSVSELSGSDGGLSVSDDADAGSLSIKE